jgi:uncharacterized protein (DUF58 family)
VVDVSRSMRFGTAGSEKRELAAELCAVLGFAAMRNNDRVGLMLAAGRTEHFVPAARGRTHLLRMLRDVLDHQTESEGTKLGDAARFATRMMRRRGLVFWISDFEDRLDSRDWTVLSRRHEVTALALRDPRDEQLPRAGWVLLEDLESGRRRLVNTSSADVQRRYTTKARERRRQTEQALARARCPVVELRTDRPYLPALMRHFNSRHRRGVA